MEEIIFNHMDKEAWHWNLKESSKLAKASFKAFPVMQTIINSEKTSRGERRSCSPPTQWCQMANSKDLRLTNHIMLRTNWWRILQCDQSKRLRWEETNSKADPLMKIHTSKDAIDIYQHYFSYLHAWFSLEMTTVCPSFEDSSDKSPSLDWFACNGPADSWKNFFGLKCMSLSSSSKYFILDLEFHDRTCECFLIFL